MSDSVEFPPLENGLDYLADAVNRLIGTPSVRDLKYAVLHLHAGVEVLLKYRLICQDWRLILEDRRDGEEEVTEADYEAGMFRSIGIGKALRRLQDLGITFTTGEKKAAAALDRLRNQVQHHGLNSTAEAVEGQAAKVLGFVLDFIDTHITPDVHRDVADAQVLDDTMRELRGGLGAITALVDGRMQKLRPELDAAWTTAWCPECGQRAVLLDGGSGSSSGPETDEPRCLFCTARWDSRAYYLEDFTGGRLKLPGSYEVMMNGGDPPTDVCPECGADMVVWFDLDTGERGPNPIGLCFSCESEFDDRCPRCDAPVAKPVTDTMDEESMLCENCLEDLIGDA